jgi:hypothetical protein
MTLLNRLFSGPSLKKEISNDHQEASAKAKRDQIASPEPRNSSVLRGSFAYLPMAGSAWPKLSRGSANVGGLYIADRDLRRRRQSLQRASIDADSVPETTP